MGTTKQQIDEHDTRQAGESESTDADYLAWRDAKVDAALTQSRRHPEQRIPQSRVWKRFGLES